MDCLSVNEFLTYITEDDQQKAQQQLQRLKQKHPARAKAFITAFLDADIYSL